VDALSSLVDRLPPTAALIAVLVLLVISVPAFGALVAARLHAAADSPARKRAPAAIVKTLDGKPFDLGSYVGRAPMLLEFWATWCPYCKRDEAALESVMKILRRTAWLCSPSIWASHGAR